MRLVILTNILAPYRIPLFQALADRVENLLVLLMAHQEENRNWTLPANLVYARVLPGFHLRPPGRSVSIHLNYGLGRILRDWKPDAIISGGFSVANMSALLYCKRANIPFVGWGELLPGQHTSWLSFRSWVRHIMGRYSTGALASSSLAKDAFCSYGIPPDRVQVSLMPIDVEFFHRKTQALRNSEHIRDLKSRFSRPCILFVGQIIHRKGIRELLNIYEHLWPSLPSASLILVGDGRDRTFYEELVRRRQWPNVHFEGFVQPDQLPRYFAVADVFIFPTLSDPFGAVLGEAMAAELPVVTSIFSAATHDLVEHGVSGFHIDPRHPKTASRVLFDVLRLSDEAKGNIGKAAYRQVKQHDCQSAADNMVYFVKGLTGGMSKKVGFPKNRQGSVCVGE
jgi:glycosyltransferase involved in cell wall biosynthesis